MNKLERFSVSWFGVSRCVKQVVIWNSLTDPLELYRRYVTLDVQNLDCHNIIVCCKDKKK